MALTRYAPTSSAWTKIADAAAQILVQNLGSDDLFVAFQDADPEANDDYIVLKPYTEPLLISSDVDVWAKSNSGIGAAVGGSVAVFAT